ncbi:MAG: chromosome segregation protein SMC [Nitrospira sp.]|nr:chromosome segregation protein SMC [Nitrospira sp.]
MRLKSLELTGFKSFAEGKLDFPPGVTAVVGPNGAGKSNVVDAILWVLGEQSTKTLRSERMEDVIFNGTESRKPLGMAEVSLILSGFADRHLEGLTSLPSHLSECHEVMITRRLYRNGDSEYLMNKVPCRLKDIRSLLLDTRAGSKGHTVIEQGRIEQILNASPQERRELIEETAGIVRYKKQKAEALRKLDSTQQNLLRVRDIIAEVQRQLNQLDRQARQARAYQGLSQEARSLEIRLLVWNYRTLLESLTLVESELASVETKESGQMAEQARLSAGLEEVRLGLTTGDQAVGRIREELTGLERRQAQALAAAEVERGRLGLYEQQRAQALEERARLKDEREQAAAAITALSEQLSQTKAEIQTRERSLEELEKTGEALVARRATALEEEAVARRRSLELTVSVASQENLLAGLGGRRDESVRRAQRLAGEQAEIESQRTAADGRLRASVRSKAEAEGKLQALRQDQERSEHEDRRLEASLAETDQLVSRQQEELAAVESRLRALQGVIREEMGYGREGAEDATSLRAACGNVRQAIAEWLVVPPGLEQAIEAALGERVRAWLVESPPHARDAISFLKKKRLGRGSFLPLRPRWAGKAHAGQADGRWPALKDQPGVLGRALDLVQVSGEYRDASACLLGSVVLVDTLETAMRLWEMGLWSAPDGPTLATLDGELLDAAGVVTGGAAGETGGLLQRRREIQQLEAKRGELAGALEESRRQREQLSAEGLSLKQTRQRLDESIREAELSALTLTKDEASLTQNMAELVRRIETIRTEGEGAEEERRRLEDELASGRKLLGQSRQEQAKGEASLAELSQALRGMEEESQALQQRMMDARVALSSLCSRREHDEADVSRLSREQEERNRRTGSLEEQVVALADAAARSLAEQKRNEALVHELEGRASRVRSQLIEAQDAQARDAERARQVEGELAAVREALTASREARTTVEIRRAEIKTQLGSLESTLTGTYQLSVAEALAQASAQEPGEAGAAAEEAEEGSGEGAPADPTQALRDRLQKIRDRLSRMGAINLAAIEEHRELEERHRFLTAQEEDLANSIKSLREIIHRINRTTKQMFLDTFNELQEKFGEVFARFFIGGRAELIMVEPEAGPDGEEGAGEPGVDIVAQPPGKRLKSITMLSGGEKTLTAMALIFASFLIRPTPFCILDEIDAPLDEENIGRFTSVLLELAAGAQFIVITHNKRTMAVADSLFGVTMEEAGISKLVSVRLADLQPA